MRARQKFFHSQADIAHGRRSHGGPGRNGGVFNQLEQLGACGDEGTCTFDVIGEGRGTEGKDLVVAAQQLHDALAHGRQKTGEQRVVFGEAAATAHGGNIDTGLVALGQGHDGIPGLAAVHGSADHKSRRAGRIQCVAKGGQGLWIGAGLEAHMAQRDGLAGNVPVVCRDGNKHGAARLLHGDVVGTCQGLGHVLGAGGLATPFHIGLGQLGGIARVQKRVELQQRASLLAGRDDHGRAVLEGREDIGHGVTDTGGGVQIHKAGIACGLGIAIGHAHDHGFLQAQLIGEVLGVVAKQRQLGGARVAKDAGHAQFAQHGYDGMADGVAVGRGGDLRCDLHSRFP